ncbi:lipopolysaccharide biosynthesis protein [Pararhizobium antarcticum]|uniref:Transporter n=1 Tax=Pararhizobium antarcticum TaxID=1798805 RepID=A0A657LSA1_9HYPH|nr:transporter [Pararhizobium antarcticum]OJF95249.1 transporter [Rhizobium sp. 58]OJF95382.1 transporter [Pararhizobium antarcticum]
MITFASTLYTRHRGIVHAYLSMTGGSAGRLVLSLVYFICVANGLSIAEFGLFATASATGIMISRLLAFGFMSPLYRVATVKPLLVGTYSLGFLAGAFLSLPLIIVLALAGYYAVFAQDMALWVFAAFMAAEILFWRGLEVIVIVLNGLGRFGKAALLVVIGTGVRTIAALAFSLPHGAASLATWSLLYLIANAVCLAIALIFFLPRMRLRWRPALYLRRWADSVTVAGAEVLFYVQSEFDKIAVLAIGGPEISGIYAIIMRLADLTALPVRSFNTLLVQKIMRTPETIGSWRLRLIIEAVIVAVSCLAITSMAVYLHMIPNGLGNNVAQVAPWLMAVLLVPAFRNLVEYHSELLYATGHTIRRIFNLVVAGVLKVALLAAIMETSTNVSHWAPLLNGVYLGLYMASFSLTYSALRMQRGRVI